MGSRGDRSRVPHCLWGGRRPGGLRLAAPRTWPRRAKRKPGPAASVPAGEEGKRGRERVVLSHLPFPSGSSRASPPRPLPASPARGRRGPSPAGRLLRATSCGPPPAQPAGLGLGSPAPRGRRRGGPEGCARPAGRRPPRETGADVFPPPFSPRRARAGGSLPVGTPLAQRSGHSLPGDQPREPPAIGHQFHVNLPRAAGEAS